MSLISDSDHPYVSYPVDGDAEPPQWFKDMQASEPVFRLGDHVRIRVNAECDYCVDVRYPECAANGLKNDGRFAIITDIDPPESHNSEGCWCNYGLPDHPNEDERTLAQRHAHRYWVKFCAPMPHDEDPNFLFDLDAHYAATELEPAGVCDCLPNVYYTMDESLSAHMRAEMRRWKTTADTPTRGSE